MDAYLLQLLEQQQGSASCKPRYKLTRQVNPLTGDVVISDNKSFLPGGLSGSEQPIVVHPSYHAYMCLDMARSVEFSLRDILIVLSFTHCLFYMKNVDVASLVECCTPSIAITMLLFHCNVV